MQAATKGAIPLPEHIDRAPHVCQGCALQEVRGGRVCPAAREVHHLPDVRAEHHAKTLYAAVLAEAQGDTPSLAELVRHEAVAHHTGVLPAAINLGLLAAPTPDPLSTDSPKEIIRVAIPSRIQR